MPEYHQAVYVISVAAELAGVHPQTLRIYERKGLVRPGRTGGGSRRYSEADIALLRRIQDLTNDGLNLAGVKKVLELEHELALANEKVDRAREQIELLQGDTERRVDDVHRQYRRDLVPVRQAVVLYETDGKPRKRR